MRHKVYIPLILKLANPFVILSEFDGNGYSKKNTYRWKLLQLVQQLLEYV